MSHPRVAEGLMPRAIEITVAPSRYNGSLRLFRKLSIAKSSSIGFMMYRTLLLATALALCSLAAFPADADAPGISNFHKVDDHVYRGGQPSSEGLVSLSKLGIKTVIDLRLTDGSSQVEKKVVEGLGMHYVSVPMKGLSTPSDAAVAKVLSLLQS